MSSPHLTVWATSFTMALTAESGAIPPGREGGVHSPDGGDDPVERLVRELAGPGHRVTGGPVWLMVAPLRTALPVQGWKLHLSTRAAVLPDLVRAVVPVLAEAGCAFKLARSRRVLAELNDGMTAPASVGKAVTVYPDQQRVRELGLELAALLAGWSGPRILSDRRVAPSAPVYYRYGPFTPAWEADSLGLLGSRLHGPEGEVFEGAATLTYRQPSWVTDPFTEAAVGQTPESAILGGHYQITAGLHQAAQGNVCRAVDLRDGRTVVIKQARALVAEAGDQIDSRMRLRNERRVLQVLAKVDGVPRFLDHFSHGDDEFLVTSDCGPASLADDVLRHGCYPAAPGPRSLGGLAVGIARIVDSLHRHGVIMRDLTPRNIVIGESGPSVLDFGIASYDGLHLPGATPGYAPARQWRDEPPAETDDYHALGMTLLYAATRLEPVTLGGDHDQPRAKALRTIGSLYGEHPTGIMALIADLLSDEEAVARAAFADLIGGRPAVAFCSGNGSTTALPVIGAFGPEQAAEITGMLLADLVVGTRALLDSSPVQQAAHDASIHHGSAGIGLELLHHLSESGVAELAADLGTFSVAAAQRVKLPPGLFAGTTGVTIFLQEAAASGISVPALPWDPPGPDWEPTSNDLIAGAAGVGLGHLWLYQASGDPAHLAAAVRCGEDIMAGRAQFRTSDQTLTGVDLAASRAHGLAGVTEFLLALAARTGDQPIRAAAAEHAHRLADRTRLLLPEAASSAAAPIAVSWCQGLAGIGQVLAQAAVALDDPGLSRLASELADACVAYTPRFNALARCCGAAGVGHFLIDLAITGQDERYLQAAYGIGRQMLLRSGGPPGHPVFVQDDSDRSAVTWAFGIAGLLSFFRRLTRRTERDSVPLPGPGGMR